MWRCCCFVVLLMFLCLCATMAPSSFSTKIITNISYVVLAICVRLPMLLLQITKQVKDASTYGTSY